MKKAAPIFFLFLTQTFASCKLSSIEDAIRSAEVIFTGEVINVRFVDSKSDRLENFFQKIRTILTIKVSGVWKGDVAKLTTLYSYHSGRGGSLSLIRKGDNVIIYATRGQAKEWLKINKNIPESTETKLPKPDEMILQEIWFCSRSGLIKDAAEDLKKLGPAKTPLD